MKILLPLFFLFGLASCQTTKHSKSYKIINTNSEKILQGSITRSLLENDTAFSWFTENMKWGKADEQAVSTLSKHTTDIEFIVFAGTWCHDSHNLLPVFYRLVDKANFPEKNIQLIAVNRKKEALNNLPKQYQIMHTPTFIILKNKKEIGRVVEYGKYRMIDKEIAEIIEQNP